MATVDVKEYYRIYIHRVHEKTITLYTLPQLWQTTSDFNV